MSGEEAMVLNQIQAAGDQGASNTTGRGGVFPTRPIRYLDKTHQDQNRTASDGHGPMSQVSDAEKAGQDSAGRPST